MNPYSARVVITGMESLTSNGFLDDTVQRFITNQLVCPIAFKNEKMDKIDTINLIPKQIYKEFNNLPRNTTKTMTMATYFMYRAIERLMDRCQIRKVKDWQDIALFIANTGTSFDVMQEIVAKFKIDPSTITTGDIFTIFNNSTAFSLAKALGFEGQVVAPSASCSTSLQSLALGYQSIVSGKSFMALCGGSDEWTSFIQFTFDKLGIGGSQCRPFMSDRRATVIGDGASVFLLEEYHSAIDRGATIYGEVIGIGTSMSNSLSASSTGSIVKCMNEAIWQACEDIQDDIPIHFVDTHGTGTQIGDLNEATAISDMWYKFSNSVITAWKWYVNHTLAASGLHELGLTLSLLDAKKIIPDIRTINAETILPYTKGKFHVDDWYYTLKNSFGLGGVNTSVVVATNANRKY